MFTANYTVQKNYQNELIRQAEHYRRVKAAQGSGDLVSRVAVALGKLMVFSGQGLLALSEAVR